MRRRRAEPSAPLVGEVAVPGDKSISHRALLLAALGDGSSRVIGPNAGDDVRATARAISLLGAGWVDDPNRPLEVKGCGRRGLQ